MEVIKLNKKLLKVFGMCLNDENATQRERTISKIINWMMLSISLCTIGVSIEYIVSHFSDTESVLFAVMQVSANTASGGGYWTFYNNKYKVSKFLNQIENLVKLRICQNHESRVLYEKAEVKSTFVAKWPLIVFIVNYDFVLIFATTYTVIFEMIPGRSDPATWYSMYKLSYPFDVHTLHGYFGYLIMVIIALHTYAILITSQVAFFLGSSFYLDAFTENFDKLMRQLNQIEQKPKQSINTVKERLFDGVKFNIQIIELFHQLSSIVTGIIFFQLLCGAVFCSTSIYQLDLASKHINPDFFILIFASTVSIATTLPYCYYSAHISLRLQSIGDSAYHTFIWYEFPCHIQRDLPLIIQNSERPKFFSGYGFINCSLETFKKILNTAGSYYIMFKTVMKR
ncbi:odorant receptor 43b-like isoform X1 [Contarinia nasturtii]|uniref:odorant receptor 43b-like isoform X1 n=2 Tax=Contarinia nasturtii TaxID=265458 RepID=UPI0012D49661|nr:odorant receptor 43b-like isoform X1 [Contarinia nasturtii]